MSSICETIELKPCLKCGQKPRVTERRIGEYIAYCENLQCKFVIVTNGYKTWQEAVDAWNVGNVKITPVKGEK